MNIINSFVDKLQKILTPIGAKIGKIRFLQAISSGLMILLPLTIIGAFFTIVANPPATPALLNGYFFSGFLQSWVNFARTYNGLLMAPYYMTMGIFSLVATFSIAYNMANLYKMKAFSIGVIATIMFLMIAAPISLNIPYASVISGADLTKIAPMNMLLTSFLGAEGLFVAIITAFVSFHITYFCYKKKLNIKLPPSVPPMVSETFANIMPLVLNILIIYGLNVILLLTTKSSLPQTIMQLLKPGISAVNSPIMIMLVMTIGGLFWCVGIHGGTFTSPIIMPILMSDLMRNAALVSEGLPAEFHASFLFGASGIGGMGGTLGLVFLMSQSKSAQLKAVGRISLIPGTFGINEPVIFGGPIVLNPILCIPFLLTPIVCMSLLWFAYSIGIINVPFNAVLAMLPVGVGAFLQTLDIRAFIFMLSLIPVSMAVYYPFFKVYERQLLEKENEIIASSNN